MIQDIIGADEYDAVSGMTNKVYKQLKKGTVTYSNTSGSLTQGSKPMPYTGVYGNNPVYTCPTGSTLSGTQCTSIQTPTSTLPATSSRSGPPITLALYVAPDPSTCKIQLIDVSGQNSGTSIQPNTPALYTPMIYAAELVARSTSALGSSVRGILSTASTAIGSSKPILKNYRVNTYDLAGAANTSTALIPCNLPCKDTAIQQKMMAYYKTLNNPIQIHTILDVSSPDRMSCHAKFINTSQQTITGKFTFSSTCNVSEFTTAITGYNSLASPPMPTDDQILDITKELSATLGRFYSGSYKNPNVSPFTNYSPSYTVAPEALDVPSFGQDVGRNAPYEIREAQFDPPLVQNLPVEKRQASPKSYKFLRFTPTQLRSAKADAVSVGKFIFFFDNYPLFLKGSVSNPMGTWEGTMHDVIGPGHRSGWSDTHKKSIVFAFRDPIAVDAYTWTTATPNQGIDGDPISWKLEGSPNGTFWTLLDSQERFPTPTDRFADLRKFHLKF
jgi:hypothetical protein